MLATGDNGRRSRVWLQDRLWGNADLEKGQASLRREISNLRKTLNAQDADMILRVSSTEVELDLNYLLVDFLSALDGKADRSIALGAEFLEGLDIPYEEGFEDWLRLCRSSLDELREKIAATASTATSFETSTKNTSASFKTKLAILPFTHWTTDPNGSALASSLVEETSHVLSRYATLLVIDPATSLSFSGKDEQLAFIKRSNLRYFVGGNIRQDGDRLKITVSLTDCQSELKIFSKKFEESLSNFFDLPDEIAAALAPEIDGCIDRNEKRIALKNPVQDQGAYELYWKANAAFRNWSAESIGEAISLTDAVLELEPGNAWAKSLGGFCHAISAIYQWSSDPAASRRTAKDAALKAVEWEPSEPIVLGYAAGTLALIGEDIENADRLVKRALEMDFPTSGMFFWSGWIDLIRRDFGAAQQKFETCLEINPNSAVRPFMLSGMALSKLMQASFDDAEAHALEALQLLPNQPIVLASAGAAKLATGKNEEAASIARTFLSVGGIETLSPLLKDDREKLMVNALVEKVSAGEHFDIAHLFPRPSAYGASTSP